VDERTTSKKFPLLGPLSEDFGAISLQHMWADVFALRFSVLDPGGILVLKSAVSEALSEAQTRHAKSVAIRLVKGEAFSEEIAQLLPNLGFIKKLDRVEYQKSVEELPDDSGTPLIWKTAEELSWQPADIAKVLMMVAVGDPNTSEDDDPLAFIQDFLVDPELTAGPQCIHVGYLSGEIAAFAVVQIKPQTGWSRISYMGTVPKFRGQGLGKWIHRFCFRMMKQDGGKLYHGGTVTSNTGMIRLFESSGSEKFREMSEWECIFT
jgi:ribosomal protein S18 acetylase RimI-like enzyme